MKQAVLNGLGGAIAVSPFTRPSRCRAKEWSVFQLTACLYVLLLCHSAAADTIEPEVGASVGYGFLIDRGGFGGPHLAIGVVHPFESSLDVRVSLVADFLRPTASAPGSAAAL